jgi:hypothetical protein
MMWSDMNDMHLRLYLGLPSKKTKSWRRRRECRLAKIVSCRKNIEEQVIIFYARNDGNLEAARERFVNEINKDCGPDIGIILWQQTCTKFASYFTEELEQDNKKWCHEGRVPYHVLDHGEYPDELY